MRYWAVVFLLAFQTVNILSRTTVISGKLSRKIDEQKMQVFLNELKICKEKGEKMKAIIIDNQSLTIIQNSSLRSLTNLTKSITEFNIILKDIIVASNQCEGIVIDANFNYNIVKILLLCYENDQIVGWNNMRKTNQSIMDDGILKLSNYIQKLIDFLHPSYLFDRYRNYDKINTIRYHFIPNEIKREEKTTVINKRLSGKATIFLILINAFICFMFIIIQGIRWSCGRKKIICNIHDEQQIILPSLSKSEKSNLLIKERTTINKPYYIKLKQPRHHLISYFK